MLNARRAMFPFKAVAILIGPSLLILHELRLRFATDALGAFRHFENLCQPSAVMSFVEPRSSIFMILLMTDVSQWIIVSSCVRPMARH